MRLLTALFAASTLAATAHAADLTMVVVVDPASAKDSLTFHSPDFASSFARQTGQTARIDRATQLEDVMRATRTKEYDILIGPATVAASAKAHGYVLLGVTRADEAYLLVTAPNVRDVQELKGKKMYLPQQDSAHAYMAKGMLNEAGLSLKALSDVQYKPVTGAGLAAVSLGMASATVVRQSEYDEWQKVKTGETRVLLRSKPVPSGLTVAVKGDMPVATRGKVGAWAATATGAKLTPVPDSYDYVSGMGHFTPNELPGAKRVGVAEVLTLVKAGAVVVDVRSDKEYKARHIDGAINVSYIEKSLKDVDYDAKQDAFALAGTLDPAKPTIFYCNGPECWKSYKASKAAVQAGFKTVYWFRGGMPEWQNSNEVPRP